MTMATAESFLGGMRAQLCPVSEWHRSFASIQAEQKCEMSVLLVVRAKTSLRLISSEIRISETKFM